MKNLIFVLALYVPFLCHSQVADDMWMVKDGTSSEVTISNFTDPCTTCDSRARDDFFIILDDGSYYNSRVNYIPLRVPPAPETPIYYNIEQDNKISLKAPRNIMYLYTTNPYDDDPPESRSSAGLTNNPNEIGRTIITNSLSANHDIVPENDITLIIDTKSENGEYTLTYNQVLGVPIPIYGGLFNPSKVFRTSGSDSSCFYTGNFTIKTIGNDSITFSYDNAGSESPFLYINLRPNAQTMAPYFQTATKTNSAVFGLRNNTKKSSFSLVEQIVNAHDPNKLIAQEIFCEDNEQSIEYFCTFRNSTESPAKNIEVEIQVPDFIDPETFSFISGEFHDDSLNRLSALLASQIVASQDGNLLTLSFDKITLRKCVSKDSIERENNGRLSFTFTLSQKQDSQVDFENTEEVNFKPSMAKTVFNSHIGDAQSYVLVFEDHLLCDFTKPDTKLINGKEYIKNDCIRNLNGDCNEPVIEPPCWLDWLKEYWWFGFLLFPVVFVYIKFLRKKN